MNLIKFSEEFAISWREDSPNPVGSGWFANIANNHPDLGELLRLFGGCVFEQGLYRVHSPAFSERSTAAVELAFPQFNGMVAVFGQDWQGNQFGLRLAGSPCVLLFQIGAGQVFEIADSIQQAHDVEFVEFTEESLSVKLWREWLSSGGAKPSSGQCIGFVNPLFLGGLNTIQNLQICDTEVYWHVTGQLLRQVHGLPVGTRIANVSVKSDS